MDLRFINQIKPIYGFRKSIVNSCDEIIKDAKMKQKNSSIGQLNLFLEIEDGLTIIPQDLNAFEVTEMIERETESIGLSILYDEFSDYFLYEKVLCNISLSDLRSFNEDKSDMIFIGKLIEIRNMTSKKGNKYAKLKFSKQGNDNIFYLFGRNYEQFYDQLIKNKIYIIECFYSSKNSSYSIVNITCPDSFIMSEYISDIAIVIKDKESIPVIRRFLFEKMRIPNHLPINKAKLPEEIETIDYSRDYSDKYNLIFMYKNLKIPVDYNVTLTYQDYIQLLKLGAIVRFKRKKL